MKTRQFILVAIAATLSLIGFAAQAAGIDLSQVFAMSPEIGIGLASCMGSIELIGKTLDKIGAGFEQVKAAQTELAERVFSLEQRGTPGNFTNFDRKAVSLADQVVKGFTDNAELFAKTKSLRLELKAASDPITTSNGRAIMSGGVGFVQGGVLGLQNALPVRAVATTALEYSRYTGQQGAAGVQGAEGDSKAAVRPDHSLVTQNALTVAGFAKMSRQSLDDSNELRRAVEVTLNRSVATALDAALVNGATGFTGGFEGLATSYTSLLYTSLVDAISEGVATMQTAGFVPDVVALHPADWLAITVAKGTANDHYLSGSYLGQIEPVLRGLRVVLSPSIDAGKAMVLDSSHSELLIVSNFTVELGYTNDDFVKNLAVLLGEMRVLPVFRTAGSARLITPKA